MTISKLPSGRYRARVKVNGVLVPAASVLGLRQSTFATKREARDVRDRALAQVRGRAWERATVAAFWERWTTDALFARPKASTNKHNQERTKAFAERYGSMLIRNIDDGIVAEWLAGGSRNGQAPALRAMFNDAASAKGGRLIKRNPFANLGIAKTRGNTDVDPPDQEVVWQLIRAARKVAGPYFSAWIQVAAFTGMRPGELDSLRWENIDFARARIHVVDQVSRAGGFTLPKNGKRRFAPLTEHARAALVALPRASEFCFINLRGEHWTASSRAYHWKATRAAVGYEGSLYLATRHHAGSYMTNVLLLPSEDVAIALGHTDGGELVRRLYGHRDKEQALDRVLSAYQGRANVVPMALVRGSEA